MYNYDNKFFKAVSNSEAGEVGADTIFHYRQRGAIVTATYFGGEILEGQLIATCNEHGELDARYQHINRCGQILTGTCHSVPERLSSGRLRLHESWQWTGGKEGAGHSVIEEIAAPD